MFKASLFALLTLVAGTTMAATADQALLQKAEQYRGRASSALVDCQVELYQGDQLEKSRLFQVYLGTDERSLVVFKSKADAGQKVLMKGNDFWMLMPKSRRPIRITPMQKLLGEAALGDIATLSWSKQYQVAKKESQGQSLVLTLTAISDAASYQKIVLRLDAADLFPLSADLYLRSGLLAKSATFERGERDGQPSVVAMALSDNMKKGSKTVVRYQQVQPLAMPDKLFNPQILLRANLEQLLAD
ncbi:outer membrane lipoprotein-sorting protein [Gallaecimonas kandeliae]|uniref:outer membrane lipoprotein-sorting protein n=1 Tax=Gallaecimonas kandeliae TaxID=3029055 RepID=UPI00264871D4|nr:outer membrane lipoprotein-sorting protein [Gallaecimonas kandeliae]WKE64778.1 outer membrane lipoprotein-sorting protein [Gallaecimonas kandeliae]